MKKIFTVHTPREIIMGDPSYFEKYEGRDLTNLIIKRRTTKKDTAKVKLEEVSDPQFNKKSVEMTLYIAPEDYIDVYVKDQYYKNQTIKQKMIGVDSKEYLISIDNNKNIMKTDTKGWWGTEYVYRHKQGGKIMLDAIVINVSLPEDMSLNEAEKYVKNMFKSRQ